MYACTMNLNFSSCFWLSCLIILNLGVPVFCGSPSNYHSQNNKYYPPIVVPLTKYQTGRYNSGQSASKWPAISQEASLINYPLYPTGSLQNYYNKIYQPTYQSSRPPKISESKQLMTYSSNPNYYYVSNLDSSYGKSVPKIIIQPQLPYDSRRIQRSVTSSALHFLKYFIPYAVSAITLAGLLFYFFIGFPSWLRAWLRKVLQGLFGVGRHQDSLQFRMDSLNAYTSNLNQSLGQVRVALEGNWLRKLQESVEREHGKNSGTYAHCCILPKEGPRGMADCQIFKLGARKRGLKCSTNLTYNLEFGSGPSTPKKNTKKSKKKFIHP